MLCVEKKKKGTCFHCGMSWRLIVLDKIKVKLEIYKNIIFFAIASLTFSFVHWNRMILKYLIPVKLSMGILPKDWLLEKYNLVEVWHAY
jgi:hypothetical protein